jgi:hypothetical protein
MLSHQKWWDFLFNKITTYLNKDKNRRTFKLSEINFLPHRNIVLIDIYSVVITMQVHSHI